MPDALELPRVRRAVVPLVRAGHAVVGELVADRLPGLAAVVGALDELAEPAAGLRRVDAVRIDRRPLEVVDLPAGEVGAAHVPPVALAVRLRTNAPLRVPTRTRTPLMRHSLLSPCRMNPHEIDRPREALPKISRQDAKDAKWILPNLHFASFAPWRPNVRQNERVKPGAVVDAVRRVGRWARRGHGSRPWARR